MYGKGQTIIRYRQAIRPMHVQNLISCKLSLALCKKTKDKLGVIPDQYTR